MRGVLIDPKLRRVQTVYDDFEQLNIILFNIQADLCKQVPLGKNHVMVVDDLGPFRKDQYWFGIKEWPTVAIAGRAVMLGIESNEGTVRPCQFPTDVVERLTRWFDDPREAEQLMPPTRIVENNKEREIPFEGFRTMDKVFVDRNGRTISYDPERTTATS